jgi:hypothetical protein
VKSFLGLAVLVTVLLLKSFSKGCHFVTKTVVFNLFTALFNFGDIVCGCDIFVGWDMIIGKHLFIALLCVDWGCWANFRT